MPIEPTNQNWNHIGKEIKRLRVNELQLTQRELSDVTGVSVRTISRIENGEAVSGRKLKELLSRLQSMLPSQDPVELGGQYNLQGVVDGYNVNDKYLELFEGQGYVGFYMTDGSDSLQHLTIGELRKGADGCLFAPARAHERGYYCRVLCHQNTSYTVFTLELNDRSSDYVCMLLPNENKIKRTFDAGIGALVSIAYPSGADSDVRYPRFQLMAMVSDSYIKKIGNRFMEGNDTSTSKSRLEETKNHGEQIVKGILLRDGMLRLAPENNTECLVRVPNIRHDSKQFYRKLRDLLA